MYKYIAYPLVEPIQKEEELRGAPPGTVLSEEACAGRIERAETVIRNALPRLLHGNRVWQNFRSSTLHIETDQDLGRMLNELGLRFIYYSERQEK